MRNRFFALLSALLILALAVPAVAGGPNDNGNGIRAPTYEEIRDFETEMNFPICRDGERVGDTPQFQSHYHSETTMYSKADQSRGQYLAIGSVGSNDAAYRFDWSVHQVVNSIDVDGTGLPNVYNMHDTHKWSDSRGVYAKQSWITQTRWDKDGNPTQNHHDTGFVCLRDTITP